MDEKEKRIEANKIKSLYFNNEISDEEIIQLISKKRELIDVELMSTSNLMVDAVACNRFEVAKRLVDMGSDINWKCFKCSDFARAGRFFFRAWSRN